MTRLHMTSFVAVVLVAACGGSGSSGEIAFTVKRGGFGEIWVMDPDGGSRRQLTESPHAAVDASGSGGPAWSPDGKLIAYVSSGEAVAEDQRDLDIYVMGVDGRDARRLTNDRVPDGTPAWSPDGDRIAFAHARAQGTEKADGVIVSMDTNGEGRIEITRHDETPNIVYDSQPAWSPDGSLIAFARATFVPGGDAHVDIYVVEPTGAGERLLIEDASEPAWAPDGIRIAFTSDRSNRDGHENEIYVMDADGSDVGRLTTNDVWDLEPDWR